MQAIGAEAEGVVNTGSYFSGLASMIKYTGSQWSLAQVRVALAVAPDQTPPPRHTCAIVTDGRVLVATHSETQSLLVCAALTEQGGECQIMSQTAFSD